MFKQIKSAFLIFFILTLITGVIYPLLITLIAQNFFPYQANGSLIIKNGKVIGSKLIGQEFDDPKYFWSRPSATSPVPYNSAFSSGSNIGPTNILLIQNIEDRIKKLKTIHSLNTKPIPVDLVTNSASGLDPNISVASALYQAKRIADSRGLEEKYVINLIKKYTQEKFLGIIGERVVNVLLLNIELDVISFRTIERNLSVKSKNKDLESSFAGF
jgi:potassium-transporting ATPase KdpC subunit